jgi:hypothetical protein
MLALPMHGQVTDGLVGGVALWGDAGARSAPRVASSAGARACEVFGVCEEVTLGHGS